MKRKLLGCIGLLFIVMNGFAQSAQETNVLLNRYKDFLFLTDTSFGSLNNIPPVDKAGRWNDIDYSNNEVGTWGVATHLRRVKTLAFGWAAKNTPGYHSIVVKNNISLALNDWFSHRYKSKNWWHNEIGVPQLMRDIIILMKDSLDREQLDQCLQILGQYKLNGTGANLVWSADLGLHYGALTNNPALMKQCRDTILSVIKVTTEEGVQPDYSFHQHGKRLQMYHYGGAFLLDDIRIAWQLRGLSLAFPPQKVQLLTDFLLNGWQWMTRGINTVPGTIDRAASRRNALHSSDIRKIIPLFYDLQPGSINALKKLYATQQGSYTLQGYHYFPYADFTAYQQPAFSFFLKTNSKRTLLTESINNENLKGALLNSGDAYFIMNGNEYFNLMPVWDWDRLPGITNFISDKKDKIKQQAFVGNVSDKKSGLAVMDYYLHKNEQSLKAKKFWASHNNITVALIAGLQTDSLHQPAFTVLDQCRLQGSVTLNKPGNFLSRGVHSFKNIYWVYHNKLVYIPIEKDSIDLSIKNVTGRWSDINKSESDEVINEKVFMPSIIHDKAKSTSGYVVAYAATAQQAQKIAAQPVWKVLRNDADCQAIVFSDGTSMASFYKEGSFTLSRALHFNLSKPCLVLLKQNKIYISDPMHTGGTIWGVFNKKYFTVLLPADGTSVSVDLH